MTVYRVPAAATKRDAIRAIYAAVQAPRWASPNLDGLADVLRDLSWLPPEPVTLDWATSPELPSADREAIGRVLRAATRETEDSPRPVTVRRR
jgi:Barstar (barnase inhibitor)